MAKLKKQLIEEVSKLKTKLLAHKVLAGVLSLAFVISLASVALAGAGFSWGNVEKDVANQLVAEALGDEVDELVDLGAVASPYLPGPDFAVGDDLRFSVSRALSDATSTWHIVVPFRAPTSSAADVVVETLNAAKGLTVPTTTVELVRLSITSSTPSAYNIGCGSSSNQYATSTSAKTSLAILTGDQVDAARGNVQIENGLAAAAIAGGAGIGGGSVTKVMIGPSQPYIVCKVDTAAPGEFSGADGVDFGDMVVRFSRVRN